jgi:hypothetical protein
MKQKIRTEISCRGLNPTIAYRSAERYLARIGALQFDLVLHGNEKSRHVKSGLFIRQRSCLHHFQTVLTH